MFSLIKDLGIRRFMTAEAPTGVLAWLIAEFFYKFHSFTLECAAFLATWFAFSFVLNTIVQMAGRTHVESADS